MIKIMIFLIFVDKTMALGNDDKQVFSDNIVLEDNMTRRVTGNDSMTFQNDTLLMMVLQYENDGYVKNGSDHLK